MTEIEFNTEYGFSDHALTLGCSWMGGVLTTVEMDLFTKGLRATMILGGNLWSAAAKVRPLARFAGQLAFPDDRASKM